MMEMKKPFYSFTMKSIVKIGFGVDFDRMAGDEAELFTNAFDSLNIDLNLRSLRPGWEYLGRVYPNERRLKKNLAIAHGFCERIIEERRSTKMLPKMGGILSLLVESEKDISTKLLRDIIFGFMFAGRDVSLCYTSLNPIIYLFLDICFSTYIHMLLAVNSSGSPGQVAC